MKPFPPHWGIPPRDLSTRLDPDTVHVWRIVLDDSPERAARYQLYLLEDEITRADRCRIPHPQYQFIITRAILRILLGRYLTISPRQLSIETQPQGKPILNINGAQPIHFNVSHTKGLAFIAFSPQHSVGVDVEWVNRKIQNQDIVQRYFSQRESDYLASLPPEEQTRQFFSYWTGKEAYLKMQGSGISGGLADCEMTLNPNQARVTLVPSQNQKEPCSLFRITGSSEHVGAVAISCSETNVCYWNWSDDLPYLKE